VILSRCKNPTWYIYEVLHLTLKSLSVHSSMDDKDHKHQFKRVLTELIMSATNSASVNGPTPSDSIYTNATGSAASPSPSMSQTLKTEGAGLRDGEPGPALMKHIDLSGMGSLEGPPAHTTDAQHPHRKGSNDSLYAITDAGSPGEAHKETSATVPTTKKLDLRGDQRTYHITHYHGVTLDPSFTISTRDMSSAMQTSQSSNPQGRSGKTLLSHSDSFKGNEDRRDSGVKATGITCDTTSPSLRLHTSSTNQDLVTEDRPILPPRPSGLASRPSQHTSQAQMSSDEAEIFPSQPSGSQHSQTRGDRISLLNATQQIIRHGDTTQLDHLGPTYRQPSPLIDLNLQIRLWHAVQQNRVSDARFLLGRGAIPDLICGVPTSRDLPQTPLCRAASDNSFELMALLLHHRADSNIIVPGSLPAFRYACWAYVQNPRSSLDGIAMLVHHGARVDAIEIPVFLRMIEEVFPPGPKEVTLPTRIFQALDFISKKCPPPEEWLHMALDACSERPRSEVITWLKQSVKFVSSDRAVECVTRIIALPRSWQFRLMGLEIVLEMGVTETDVFEAVDLIETSANTQIITAEQKDDLSKVLWDARDRMGASQTEVAPLPQRQHEEFSSNPLFESNRYAYQGIPLLTTHDQTSARQPLFLRDSATDRSALSLSLPAPTIEVSSQRPKRRGLSFFSAKNKNKA
jgi:hypothetical protein